MIYHDCPGDLIRRPISYCTHVWRLYVWLGNYRFKIRWSKLRRHLFFHVRKVPKPIVGRIW